MEGIRQREVDGEVNSDVDGVDSEAVGESVIVFDIRRVVLAGRIHSMKQVGSLVNGIC